jgi:hypothetical protein
MGQAAIIIDMVQRQLLAYASLTCAEGGDASTNGGPMLADGEVDALHEGGIDLPATRRSDLLNGLEGAEHDAVPHPHQAPPAHGLHHLRVEQLRQRHPARLGHGACAVAA